MNPSILIPFKRSDKRMDRV